MDNLIIRHAKVSDLDQVATLHIEAFPGFFLTNLGKYFLIGMYRSFLNFDHRVFLVACLNGVVVGFSVGSPDAGSFLRQAKFLDIIRIFVSIFPRKIFSFDLIGKIIKRVKSTDAKIEHINGAFLLRSICVSKSFVGLGLSSKLLQSFEAEVGSAGYNLIVLTTDSIDNERAVNFYKKNNYVVHQAYCQDSVREMYLLKKQIGVDNE